MSNERKRLPGSEKLTRPEDINALSKYLGDIKKTQEEHTVLDKDNLEVPGRTTGRIPDIQELPEGKEVLDSVEEQRSLSETRIDLDASRSIELEDSLQTLDAPQDPSLDTKRIDLEDNRELPLETRRENLETLENPELSESRIDLEDNRESNLSEEKVGLDINGEETSLSDFRLDMEREAQEIALQNHIEELENNASEIELTDKIVGLENNTLSQTLSETRIDLEDTTSELTLPTQAELLENVPEVSINIQEGASGEIEAELEETKIELTSDEGKGPVERLDDTRVDLGALEETDLDNTRVDLEGDNEVDLDETRIELEKGKDTELDNTKIDLKAGEEVELEDEVIGMAGKINDPELDQTIIKPGEEAVEVSGLEDKMVDIETSQDIELEDEKLNLHDIPEAPLDNTKIERGGEDKDLDLTDFIDSLDDNREPELEDKRLNIEKKDVAGLYDSVIGGIEKKEVDLEDTRLDIEENKTAKLEDEKLELADVEEVDALYDSALETPQNPDHEGWSKKQLYDSIMMAPEDQKYEKALEMANSLGPWGMKVASLISSVLSNDSVNAETATWFDAELKKILQQMGAMAEFNFDQSGEKAQEINSEGAELNNESSRKNIPERVKDFNEVLENTDDPDFLVHYAQNQGISKPLGIDEDNNGKNDKEEAAEEAFTASDKPNYIYGKWGIGGDNRNSGYRTIPKYQLPSRGLLDALNVSNYIRFGVEELFSLWDPHTKAERVLKPMLVNEALALLIIAREQLEKLTKGNRERLPGDDMGLISDVMSGGVSGAIDNLKDNAMSALQNTFAGVDGVDKKNPLNRPRTKLKSNGGVVTWVKEVTKGFDKGNIRQDAQGDGSMDWKQLGKNLGKNLVDALIGGLGDMNKEREISFADEYLNNNATLLTLMDLCELTKEHGVESLEALKEVLKESPYITTPRRFGTIEEGRYGTMTLDTNAYWEVVIEPFCHTSMNGGYSFLPAIDEINVINKAHFGVTTAYSKWLPIVNFELQKSKLTNKSLGLYDGEIVYPVTSELSNELRMTLVDDQYKSWRTYFQKCADVSVYSSEAHSITYYTGDTTYNRYTDSLDLLKSNTYDKSIRGKHITVVDKTRPLVALYKNITFLIKIYIMTPQYATIRKFNLLCVLKDFEESFSGDIDAGGYDLNLSFSIVGENPPPDRAGAYIKKESKKSLDEILGGKEPDLLNQTPKKKGGIIKLL